MYIYSIPMRLRYAGSDTDYSNFQAQFDAAAQAFNHEAEKRKKARQIRQINTSSNGFTVVLESADELKSPSKSLAVFSRELAKMPTLAGFLDSQKHLLANNGLPQLLEEGEEEFDDTVASILKTVVDIFLEEKVQDNVFAITVQREARKEIKEICRKFVQSK